MGIFDWMSKLSPASRALASQYKELEHETDAADAAMKKFRKLFDMFSTKYVNKVLTSLDIDKQREVLDLVEDIYRQARILAKYHGVPREVFACLGAIDSATHPLRVSYMAATKNWTPKQVKAAEQKMLDQLWEDNINFLKLTEKEYEEQKNMIRSLKDVA